MPVFIFLTIQAIVVLTPSLWVARHREKLIVVALYLVALAVLLLEIWLLKNSAYGQILLNDSVQYDLFARALSEHWQGNDVSVARYRLPGLRVDHSVWSADYDVPLAKLFKSAHFLYEAYLGAFYWLTGAESRHVALGNAIFIAGVAPTVYVMASRLTANEMLARFAGVLVIVDPSFAAVGAYLLKDGLAVFLFSTFLLVSVKVFCRHRSMTDLILWILLLTALSFIRIPAVFAVYGAFVTLMAVPTWRKAVSGGKGIFLGLICSLLLTGYLNRPDIYFAKMHIPEVYPQMSIAMKMLGLHQSGKQERVGEVEKSGRPQARDEADNAGPKEEQRMDGKVTRLAKGIVYALVAPFPWVPLSKGFSGEYSELFYPGIILWIIGLPLCAYYLLSNRRDHSVAMVFIVVVVVSIIALYILVYDKFATRHRVFVLPVFWLLVSGGITTLVEKHRRKTS